MNAIRGLALATSLLSLHAFADTSVKFGGYAKLDALWSDRSAGVDSVGDQQFSPASFRSARRRARTSATR